LKPGAAATERRRHGRAHVLQPTATTTAATHHRRHGLTADARPARTLGEAHRWTSAVHRRTAAVHWRTAAVHRRTAAVHRWAPAVHRWAAALHVWRRTAGASHVWRRAAGALHALHVWRRTAQRRTAWTPHGRHALHARVVGRSSWSRSVDDRRGHPRTWRTWRTLRTCAGIIGDDLEGPARDDDLIAWPKRARLHDLLPVEVGAVGRAEVLDLKAVTDAADLAVHAGDACGLKPQVVALAAANSHGGTIEGQQPRRLPFFAERNTDHGGLGPLSWPRSETNPALTPRSTGAEAISWVGRFLARRAWSGEH
jgi:hypothetical protein